MAKREKRASGNSLRGAVAFQEELAQEALLLRRVERWWNSQEEDEFDLKWLKIRPPREESGEFLLVCAAWVDGASMVAFSSGSSLVDALHSFARRLLNGSVRWKADEYDTGRE